jgi:anaerobic magnesium-protoporphyrin IX monomethyl ester cyclase
MPCSGQLGTGTGYAGMALGLRRGSAMTNLSAAVLKRYDKDVLEFVSRGIGADDEGRFNELALRAFELQYSTDEAYRKYCAKTSISPESIRHWFEIPAVASFPFRKTLASAFSKREAEEFYSRSGVAELRRKRGPFFPDSDIRMLAAGANELLQKAYVFPDTDSIKMLFMVPIPVMAPGMVMASGLELIKRRFGTGDSRFLISFKGLDLRGLISALRQSEKTGQPLALLGATWGFDYFFDSCKKAGIRFRLPRGSRIVDSGGYVGRYTKCTKEAFFGKCLEILGIGENVCINALWLCESSTVYFDNIFRNSLTGVKRERFKELPPWSRIIAVDPLELRRLPKGKTGLLRHYDLTNRGMAIAVQTGNMGYETEGGFEMES